MVAGNPSVHVELLPMSEFRLFNRGREHDTMALTPEGKSGEFKRIIDARGQYAVVVENASGAPPATVLLYLRTNINPGADVARTISPRAEAYRRGAQLRLLFHNRGVVGPETGQRDAHLKDTDTVEAPPRRRGVPKWLVPAIGYTVSAASLIWVFWKFPFAQLGDHLRTLEWNWVALAVLFELAVYFVDAWRWGVLLRRAGGAVVRFVPAFGARRRARQRHTSGEGW